MKCGIHGITKACISGIHGAWYPRLGIPDLVSKSWYMYADEVCGARAGWNQILYICMLVKSGIQGLFICYPWSLVSKACISGIWYPRGLVSKACISGSLSAVEPERVSEPDFKRQGERPLVHESHQDQG